MGSGSADAGAAPVLVTGATGFVGSHVAEALAAAGHRLRCTVRASSRTRWIDALGPELVHVDLGDLPELAPPLDGVEVVAHVGGITQAVREEDFRRVNAVGTLRLAEAAARAGVRRFVFVSSLAARGPDGAPGPTSAYGLSKREAEEGLAALRDRMEIVVLRPAGVYGPRDADMVPVFRMARRGWVLTPAGDVPLQPVYASDVAAVTRRAVEGAGDFGPHPVAGRERYRWTDVARHLGDVFGRRVRRVPVPGLVYEAAGWVGQGLARLRGRPPGLDLRRARDLARHAWTCDVRPTERAFGWTPRVTLPEGLRRTVDWYRDAGWL